MSLKEVQDVYLAGCMEHSHPKSEVKHPKKGREHIWSYSVKSGGEENQVCLNFLLRLLQIKMKRVRVIQQKILSGDTFEEKRGKHINRPNKLDESIWKMLQEHLQTLPHKKSHYCVGKTNKLYFDDPGLNIRILYNMFADYFKQKTSTSLKMKYSTYFKYFSQKTNFAFRRPQTDVCDFCTKCEIKLAADPEDSCKLEYLLHKKKVEKYNEMKKTILDKTRTNKKCIVFEFDYGQNVPIPKLNVTSQFYKRLLWLYMFNVHVHNDGSSFMYCFIESQAKKDANSVASFLYDCFQKKLGDYPEATEVIFLSDNAGGQNKNKTMSAFCSWLARIFNVSILHLFPVRGHSYSQCDRNFGLFKGFIKKKAVITTAKPYLEAMVLCKKTNPFQVLFDGNVMKDWGTLLSEYCFKNPQSKTTAFKIQSFVQLKYKPDGILLASQTYNAIFHPFKFIRIMSLETLKVFQPPPARPGKVTAAKIKDVRQLFSFIDIDSQNWIDMFLSNSNGEADEYLSDENDDVVPLSDNE